MSRTQARWLPVLLLAGCTTMPAQIKQGGQMGQVDQDYAKAAYQLVQLDRQTSKLAAGNAADPRVPFLATQLAAKANALYPGLQAALQAEGVPEPTSLPPNLTADIEALKQLRGPEFDRRYLAVEIAAHERTLAAIEQESKTTQNAALKSQANAAMPAVRDNLGKLKMLAK